MPLAEAKKLPGVRAVFGEKYPDPVRVLLIGAEEARARRRRTHSVEFCGGTHLTHTGAGGLLQDRRPGAGRQGRAPRDGGHRPRGGRDGAGQDRVHYLRLQSPVNAESLATYPSRQDWFRGQPVLQARHLRPAQKRPAGVRQQQLRAGRLPDDPAEPASGRGVPQQDRPVRAERREHGRAAVPRAGTVHGRRRSRAPTRTCGPTHSRAPRTLDTFARGSPRPPLSAACASVLRESAKPAFQAGGTAKCP